MWKQMNSSRLFFVVDVVVFPHSTQFAGFPLQATKRKARRRRKNFVEQINAMERTTSQTMKWKASYRVRSIARFLRATNARTKDRSKSTSQHCRWLQVSICTCVSFAVSFLCPPDSFRKDNVDECIKITCIVYLPMKSPLLLTPPLFSSRRRSSLACFFFLSVFFCLCSQRFTSNYFDILFKRTRNALDRREKSLEASIISC